MTAAPLLDGMLVLPQVDTPCMTRLASRSWHTTVAVRTGSWVVGVRANSPFTAELIEERLGSLRYPDLDDRVSPNFSVEFHDASSDARSLQIIYRDSEVVGRRRSVQDAFHDLLMLLDEGPRLATTDHLVLHAGGVVAPFGDAVLVPGTLHAELLTRRSHVERAGLRVLANRTALVDPDSGRLLSAFVDPDLARIAGPAATTSEQRVVAWCVPAPRAGHAFDLPASEGVFHGTSMVMNRHAIGMGDTLRALRNLSTYARFIGIPTVGSRQLAETIVRLATGSR